MLKARPSYHVPVAAAYLQCLDIDSQCPQLDTRHPVGEHEDVLKTDPVVLRSNRQVEWLIELPCESDHTEVEFLNSQPKPHLVVSSGLVESIEILMLDVLQLLYTNVLVVERAFASDLERER